jgi:hypothetical protein
MHEFLTEVQRRPGLYFGDPDQPFTKLLAFMDGYRMGYMMARREDLSWPKEFVPPDFDEFVCQQMGAQHGADAKGWRTRIRERSSSEQDAFSLFFRLMEEYERGHK